MAEEFVLGFQAKTYWGPSGAQASNELTNMQDNELSLENGETDITTRATNGWRAFAPTLTEAGVEFKMLWRPGDAGFEAVKDAFLQKSSIALLVLDKVIGEGEGLDADFIISNFTRSEPLEEALTVDVTARITVSDRAPEWVTP